MAPQNLVPWVTKYEVDYPSGIPTQVVAGLVCPTNVIVDPRTMKVVDVLEGEPVGGACGNVPGCSADSDCQVCNAGQCGDGTACSVDADCAGKTCTMPLPFWHEYAALLGLDGG